MEKHEEVLLVTTVYWRNKLLTVWWLCLAGTATAGEQAYDLQPKLSEGKTWTMEEIGLMEIDSILNRGTVDKVRNVIRTTYRVREVSADGKAEVIATITHFKQEGNSLFADQTNFAELVNIPIEMALNSDGSVSRVAKPGTLPPAADRTFETLKMHYINFGFYMFLPDKPVRVGEEWETSHPILYDLDIGPVDFIMRFRARIDEIKEHLGKACLSISYTGDFLGSINRGRMASFEGEISGSLLFDPEDGLVVAMDMSFDQDTKTVSVEGENFFNMRQKLTASRVINDDVQ